MPRFVPVVVTGDGKEVEAVFDRIEQRAERLKTKLRGSETGLSRADLKALEQLSREQLRHATALEREQIRAAANVERERLRIADRVAARETAATQRSAREVTRSEQQAQREAVRAAQQRERELNRLSEAELRRVQRVQREGLQAAERVAAEQRRLAQQVARDRERAAQEAARAEARSYREAVQAAERAAREQQRADRERRESFKSAGKGLGYAGAAYTAAVSVPLVAFGREALDRAASFEALEKGLAAVEGGADKAQKKLVELREVAKLPGLGLREAISGQVQLNAALQDSELTTRSLRAFGNALATVGKGKADLEGVNVALSQIATKSKISAEEFNQLAERVPQIRRIIEQAYGTADTEKLQKAGIKPLEFIKTIVAELEKLPQVEGGIGNTLENLADIVDQSFVRIGKAIAPVVVPMFEKLATVIDFVTAAFEKLPRGAQSSVVILGLLAAAFGPLLVVIGAVVAAVGVIGAKVVAVSAVIGVAVAALVGLWVSNFGGIRDFTVKVAGELYEIVEHRVGILVAWWRENLPLLKQTVQLVLDEIAEFWHEWGGTISAVVGAIFKYVVTITEVYLRALLAAVRIVLQLINKDWAGAWETFVKTVTEVGRLLAPLGDMLSALLKAAIRKGVEGVISLGAWIQEQMTKLGVLIVRAVLAGIAAGGSPQALAGAIISAVTTYGGGVSSGLAGAGRDFAEATRRGAAAGRASRLDETFDLLSIFGGGGGDLTGGVGQFIPKPMPGANPRDLSGVGSGRAKRKKAEFNADQLKIARRAYEVAVQLGATDRELLALFSAGLVESGFRNLNYGDRDSLGFLQQRPSMGWGNAAQVQNIEYATRAFLLGAGTNRGAFAQPDSLAPGNLAQAVQRSAFPRRYAERLPQARRLLAEVVGDATISERDLREIEQAQRHRRVDEFYRGRGYTVERDEAGKLVRFEPPTGALSTAADVAGGGVRMRETRDEAYRREIDERYFGTPEATGYKDALGQDTYERRGGAYEQFILRQRNLDKELEAVRRDAALDRQNRELDYIANATRAEAELHELRIENSNREVVEARRRQQVLDEELRLTQDITALEDALATQGANSALRYQRAWLQAIRDVREADLAAVESQIRSQVQLADSAVLHTEQVRAKVLEHLAAQKSITQATADTIISAYDRVASWLDSAIDKLTGRLSFLNDILKAIVRQILNAAFQKLLDALTGKGAQQGGGGAGGGGRGGFLSQLGGFFSNIFRPRGGAGGGVFGPNGAASVGAGGGSVSAFGSGASTGGFNIGGAIFPLTPAAFSQQGALTAPTSFASQQAAQAAAAQVGAAAAQGAVGTAAGGAGAAAATGSFAAALAPLLPIFGAQLGGLLGGQSRLGQGLGMAGGLLLGGAGAVGLLGGAGAAIFSAGGALSSLAPVAAFLTNPFTIAAAPLLLATAFFVGRSRQRRREEEQRTSILLDAKSRINELISAVKADRLEGTEALAKAAQVRADYISQVSQLRDRKTRNIALATVRELDYLINNQLRPAADTQTSRRKAYEEFIPTFAGGGDVRRAFAGRGFTGRVPGAFTGRDPYLIRVDGDETVINPAQRARGNITDAQLAAAGVPGYQGGGQPTVVAQLSAGGGPTVVNIEALELELHVTVGPQTGVQVLGAALRTRDGQGLVVGAVRTHVQTEREDGLAGDIATVLG